MLGIEFGDGIEPLSVARGGVKRWLHCRIANVEALSEERQAELADWLESRGLPAVSAVLVTRDAVGLRLHVAGIEVDIALADLLLWLQKPELETPAPVAVKKAVAKAVRK